MTIEYEFLKWMCQDDARKIPFHLGNYKKIQGAFLLFPPFWAIWEITHVTSLCQPLFFPIILKEAYLLLTVARYLVNATLESSLVHRQSRDVQVQNHRYAWDPEPPHLAQPWRAGLDCNQESLRAGYISSASLSIIFLTLRSRDPPDFFHMENIKALGCWAIQVDVLGQCCPAVPSSEEVLSSWCWYQCCEEIKRLHVLLKFVLWSNGSFKLVCVNWIQVINLLWKLQ